MARKLPILVLALCAVAAGVSWNGQVMTPSVPTAEAVIGRPMTPMSYAGVARRTTRRAAYSGAYYGAAAANSAAYYAPPPPPTYAPPPGCVQVVDSYGRVTYRCP